MELCQTLILEKWYSLKEQLVLLPPTAVRGDTFWWECQSERARARPLDIGLDKHPFVKVHVTAVTFGIANCECSVVVGTKF